MRHKRLVIRLLLGSGLALVGAYLMWGAPQLGQPIVEIPVGVSRIERAEDAGVWKVPKDVVAGRSGALKPFVLRLQSLRTERLPVEVAMETGDSLFIRSDSLQPEDLVVLHPEPVPAGVAVIVKAGVDEESLIRETLKAAMNAVTGEDLNESFRHISPEYSDRQGFNAFFLMKLLERAYREFDEPRIELRESPRVEVSGSRALVQAEMRLAAVYGGQWGYLLGGENRYDHVSIVLEKANGAWKGLAIEGVRPLGLEERYLRLLGAEIGLPLTTSEKQEKKEFCMPCRERMAERFPRGKGVSH